MGEGSFWVKTVDVIRNCQKGKKINKIKYKAHDEWYGHTPLFEHDGLILMALLSVDHTVCFCGILYIFFELKINTRIRYVGW